ncbi:short-chain dehydrogenase [bacterium 336/3]|jgi:dehydrogenase/reductase SDR family member 7B|nr:short-chain dehydrogenase [bacterium 336/3]
MKNKVVVITGGSSGIGKACAEIFGLEGAKIVITGRKEKPLQETIKYLTEKGIECLGIIANSDIEADNANLISDTVRNFGRIDVLINNAGISMRALFEECEISVIRQLMETNFFGTVYATKFALPHIIATKGSIVGISSIAGYRGLPARSGYSASKFAMNGFLEALRTEMIPKGVHVLTAAPGFTSSNIRNTALSKDGTSQGESPRDEQKMMSAEEVAKHILHAVKKRKPELVLTGQGKLTVFLNKWLPKKVIDKLVFNSLAKENDSPLKKVN